MLYIIAETQQRLQEAERWARTRNLSPEGRRLSCSFNNLYRGLQGRRLASGDYLLSDGAPPWHEFPPGWLHDVRLVPRSATPGLVLYRVDVTRPPVPEDPAGVARWLIEQGELL